ncbi:MAG: TlpA disulfide reductase family protein [Candidatus Pedobacter colombiensis]|uniref:TlpA disulfide reductase family protein n=1 Tax=Candidatus Pedobacter colombiensis TaxID=3121371 RepID=A0AAJ5W6N7_9SPHI|nr:TlpA disulfide reductase family protein [Pedobacter sp.]WEK18984.1 MAG: TlpA disulfide reductase family protein [Pedobacter sp.]
MIKRLCGAALLISLSAIQSRAQLSVEISGQLNKDKKTPVKLFKVVEGKPMEIAASTPEEKGRFGFLFYPEYEGFYLVGTGTNLSPSDSYKFYFKAGDKLSLSISDSSYVLNGKLNSRENVVMTQWHDMVNELEQKSYMKKRSTFVDFFPQLEELNIKSRTFLAGKTTGNAKFDRLMKDNMAWDIAGYATNFLNTPRTAHPTLEQYSPYYATVKIQDFAKNTAGVYRQPWGSRVLGGVVGLTSRMQNTKRVGGMEGLKNTLDFVPNDTLKGDFVLESAGRLKSFVEYQDMMAMYGKYVLTNNQQQKSRDQLAPLASLKPGDPAFAFSYPDKNGKTVTMADLKGKVVLIDVWATWCGPCKAEIPHLKKLEQEMKGTDVQIVSISVDEAKDKEKWQKMIKDENLGGLQVFATGWGDIAKYYKITGIPRFMVFDRNGKIVTIDSPRPSEPELKALLEKTLAAK